MINMKSSISFSVKRAAAKEVGQAAPIIDGFAIDVPSEVFQTIFDAEGRQDSSTPLGPLRVSLSAAAQATVARSGAAVVKVALRRFDGRFLEEYDPDTGSLVPLHVPPCVFTVAAVDGGRALSILMKRKYLPTSASFGNAPVVLVVSVPAVDGGGLAQVAVSSRFTILSKQPRSRKPSKPPKRIRNPPPAKPVRRAAAADELALSALLLRQEPPAEAEAEAGCVTAGGGGLEEDARMPAAAEVLVAAAASSARSAGCKRSARPRDDADYEEDEGAEASDGGGSTATEEEEAEVEAVLPASYAPARPKARRRTQPFALTSAELCDAFTSLGLAREGVAAALDSGYDGQCTYEEYDADQEEEEGEEGVAGVAGGGVVLPAVAPPMSQQERAFGGLRGALTACLPPPPPERMDSLLAPPAGAGRIGSGLLLSVDGASWPHMSRPASAMSQGL